MLSQYKTSKYNTVFSTDAKNITDSAATNSVQFRWNINDLNLSSRAKLGLVNRISNSTDKWCYYLLFHHTCPRPLEWRGDNIQVVGSSSVLMQRSSAAASQPSTIMSLN